jgi:hypothetical protein
MLDAGFLELDSSARARLQTGGAGPHGPAIRGERKGSRTAAILVRGSTARGPCALALSRWSRPPRIRDLVVRVAERHEPGLPPVRSSETPDAVCRTGSGEAMESEYTDKCPLWLALSRPGGRNRRRTTQGRRIAERPRVGRSRGGNPMARTGRQCPPTRTGCRASWLCEVPANTVSAIASFDSKGGKTKCRSVSRPF